MAEDPLLGSSEYYSSEWTSEYETGYEYSDEVDSDPDHSAARNHQEPEAPQALPVAQPTTVKDESLSNTFSDEEETDEGVSDSANTKSLHPSHPASPKPLAADVRHTGLSISVSDSDDDDFDDSPRTKEGHEQYVAPPAYTEPNVPIYRSPRKSPRKARTAGRSAPVEMEEVDVVLEGEEVDSEPMYGRRAGKRNAAAARSHFDVRSDETSEDAYEVARRDEKPMSAAKRAFVLLPEPLPAVDPKVRPQVRGLDDFGQILDDLDFEDGVLRVAQDKIKAYREYLRVVEQEEIELITAFRQDFNGWGADVQSQEELQEREERRVRFDEELAAIRERRASLRGSLYDAMMERNHMIDAHIARHETNYRANQQYDFWKNRSGVDAWLFVFFIFQVVILVCLSIFLTYPTIVPPLNAAAPARVFTPPGFVDTPYRFLVLTSFFVVVGFSFWMAAYKRFTWGAISINLLIVAYTIEWGLLMHVFFLWAFDNGFRQVPLTTALLAQAFYTALACLVSHAALLGRITAKQAVLMTTIEVFAYVINFNVQRIFRISDTGGALAIYIYGGLFGLAASFVYARGTHKPKGQQRVAGKQYNEELKDHSHPRRHLYRASLFAWIGTLVLIVLWPAFSAVFAAAGAQGRVIGNTWSALSGSILISIGLSHLLHGGFHLRSFLNSTLAGGVVVATSYNAIITPWIALLMGLVAGAIATLGEWKLTAALENKLKLYDTQGVLWLFVVPALLAWLAGVITVAVARNTSFFGQNYAEVFASQDEPGLQAASWAISMGMGVVFGLVTGFLLRLLKPKEQYFRDHAMFQVGKDYGLDNASNAPSAVTSK